MKTLLQHISNKTSSSFRLAATILSLLVALNTVGLTTFIQYAESEVIEESVTECTVESKTFVKVNETTQACTVPKKNVDSYMFAVVEKDTSPSTPKTKLYLLYSQLSYDKFPVISLA